MALTTCIFNTMPAVCAAVDELVESEKQRRLLKWISIITGAFLLLTIAAIVGLTYAVVVLSKDVNSNEAIFVDKKSGSSMLVGKPVVSVVFDPNDAAALADVLNNSTVSDLTGSGRRLLDQSACPTGSVRGVSVMPLSKVQALCTYLSKPSVDHNIRLNVKKNSRDCTLVTSGGKTGCAGTSNADVFVTDDGCDIFDYDMTCSASGLKTPVNLIWASDKARSNVAYSVTCQTLCDGVTASWGGSCAVSQLTCPIGVSASDMTNEQPMRRRQLKSTLPSSHREVPEVMIHDVPMDCDSGRCFAVAAN